MDPARWEEIKANIFPGESGGDYNALFGYANRPGGQFANVNLTGMTVNDAIRFSDPSGAYGQWVKQTRPDPEKGVATPMGAYQVVGSTLQAAAKGLGLTGNEPFNEATQDRIGQWIYQTQGPGAWVGWGKGKGNGNMGRASGGGASTSSQGQMPPEMSDQDLPWLQRPKVQDTFDRLAIGLQGLTLNPNEAMMRGAQDRIQSRAAQRESKQQANRSADWLEKMGMADLAAGVRSGAISGRDAMALAKGGDKTKERENYEFLITQGRTPEEAMKIAFSGGVTVNNGDMETAFDKEAGKAQAQLLSASVESGQAAVRNLPQIQQLDALLTSAAEAGQEGGTAAFTAALGRFGIKLDGASELEAAEAIISNLVPQQRPAGSGPMSDADLALFKKSLPAMINTAEGNKIIIQRMRALAEYDMKRAAISQAALLGQISRDDAFAKLQELDASTPKLSDGLPTAPVAQGGGSGTTQSGIKWSID